MYSAMAEELLKSAAELTEASRGQISKKNFALTSKQSTTGKPAYPIHDEQHARSALGFVSMHGTPEQKAEVRKDIERKYPHLIKKADEDGGRGKYLATALAGLGLTGAGLHAAMEGHKYLGLGATGLGIGATTLGTMLAAYPTSVRKQVEQEVRDPRLYSNLRGMAALESREERRGAHKHLNLSKDHSVLSAMREGFMRGGKEKTSSMREELFKIAASGGILQRVGGALKGERGTHIAEIAGLGTLAALPADTLQAKLRSRKGEDWEHKSLLGGERGHAIGDIAGLGVLAAPSIAHLAGRHT